MVVRWLFDGGIGALRGDIVGYDWDGIREV
jgi:hypothetical protein